MVFACGSFVNRNLKYVYGSRLFAFAVSMRLYKLIESAKLNGHKPYDYLLHAFERLPYAQTREKIALKNDRKNNLENAVW